MAKRVLGALALLSVWVNSTSAQQFPPGYVDPAPLLAAAAEIGEANLRCITLSGTGYSGAVGQTFENAVNVDWPRIGGLANYTRTINWETGTSKETFDREPGLNPASASRVSAMSSTTAERSIRAGSVEIKLRPWPGRSTAITLRPSLSLSRMRSSQTSDDPVNPCRRRARVFCDSRPRATAHSGEIASFVDAGSPSRRSIRVRSSSHPPPPRCGRSRL